MKPVFPGMLLCIVFAGLFLSSCSKFGFEVTHRKYRPGYHIDWSGPVNHIEARKGKSEEKNIVHVFRSRNETTVERIERTKPELKVDRVGYVLKHPQVKASRNAGHSSKFKPSVQPKKFFLSDKTSVPEPRANDRNSFYWLSALTALLTGGVVAGLHKKLRKISMWSARNPIMSRSIQVVGHIALSSAALVYGSVLRLHDVIAGPALIPVTVSAYLLTAMFYPRRRKNVPITPGNFMKAKMADLTLILSTTMFWAAAGNHISDTMHTNSNMNSSSSVWQSFASLSENADTMFDSDEAKPKMEDRFLGLRIFGMSMVIFGFVLSIIFLVYLSCSILCAGSGAGAFMVFFFGGAILTTALIASIKAIMKGHKIPGRKTQPAEK